MQHDEQGLTAPRAAVLLLLSCALLSSCLSFAFQSVFFALLHHGLHGEQGSHEALRGAETGAVINQQLSNTSAVSDSPLPSSRCAGPGPDGGCSLLSSLYTAVLWEAAPGELGKHTCNHTLQLTIIFLVGGRAPRGQD